MYTCMAISQENAYTSFDVSLNNSIRLNRFLINPAFSYAREIAPTINLSNKRQWVKFEDSPVLYLLNYQGRLSNESRFGIGAYSQSIGVLSNTGGILNYALNVPLEEESNLTFGINTYISNSSFNIGKVITESPEILLQNQNAITLISLKPGINLNLNSFDIGIAANNIISYNLSESQMVTENKSSSFSGHIMYTKELSSYYNILDGSNFSSMLRVQNGNGATAISGNFLIDNKELGWAEVGYNSLYGANAGIGVAVSEKFLIGYSYNLSINNSLFFGSSHEFSLSYKFTDYDDSFNFRKRAQALRDKKAKAKTPNATFSQLEEERLAKAKAERERLAKEKEENDRLAQAEKDRLAALALAEKERLAREQAERDRLAALSQAEKDRLAKEQAEKDKLDAISQAEKERLAREQAEKDRLAALAQAEKDRLAKEKAEKDRLERLARQKAENDKIAKENAEIERLAREKAEQDRLAREKAEKDRLAREAASQQAEKDRLAKEAAAKAERDRLAKEAATAQAEKDRLAREAAAKTANEKLSAEDKITSIESKLNLSNKLLDDYKSDIVERTKNSDKLIKRLDSIVKERDKDLKDFILGQEDPNKFVSTTQQNAQLSALKTEIANNKKIFEDLIFDFENANRARLAELKGKGISDEDAKLLNENYQEVIDDLKNKKEKYIQLEKAADQRILKISADKEEERQRRIKKAIFDNEKERIEKDQQNLQNIKSTTTTGQNTQDQEVSGNAFDEEPITNDIAIVKKMNNVASGFYMVLGKFKDTKQRDTFIKQVVSEGGTSVNQFYNIFDASYYVYLGRFDELTPATNELTKRGTKTYNKKMRVVKVE
ncbi:MAG: PorP/SprF family type IX secretion system membrane protein [Flavobacterium sp.]|nr:PorP/SprF family type IX secretion system membrane protein [Flavobacterium sp.]